MFSLSSIPLPFWSEKEEDMVYFPPFFLIIIIIIIDSIAILVWERQGYGLFPSFFLIIMDSVAISTWLPRGVYPFFPFFLLSSLTLPDKKRKTLYLSFFPSRSSHHLHHRTERKTDMPSFLLLLLCVCYEISFLRSVVCLIQAWFYVSVLDAKEKPYVCCSRR